MPVAVEVDVDQERKHSVSKHALNDFFERVTKMNLHGAARESKSVVRLLKREYFAEFLSEAAALGEISADGRKSRRRLKSLMASISSGSFNRLTIEESENEKFKVRNVHPKHLSFSCRKTCFWLVVFWNPLWSDLMETLRWMLSIMSSCGNPW